MTPEQEAAVAAAKARLAQKKAAAPQAAPQFTDQQRAAIEAAKARLAATPAEQRRAAMLENIAKAKAGDLRVSPDRQGAQAEADSKAMAEMMKPPPLGVAGAGQQFLSGFNEGVAALAGAPVDLATSVLNLGIAGANYITGAEIPAITDPVGGSGDTQALMRPFTAPPRPDSAVGRYSRSIGREVGASAIPVGAAMARSVQPAMVALGGLESAIGSGIGSQAAQDIFPGSDVAATIGGLVGGMAPLAFNRAPAPQAPSVEDLKSQAGDLYQRAEARPGAVPSDVADLKTAVTGELSANSRITPTGRVVADGNVKKFLDVLDDFDNQSMTPGQMKNLRTFLQDAAASADAGERRMGTILLKRFDEWRGNLVPEVKQADALYGRAKRAEDVDLRIEKAERRAASTGTGGNTVNAMRQNIRAILDNETARRGYSPAEIAAMEAIVRGDMPTNALRLIGRLSPTSGALPLAFNILGTAVNPAVGGTIMGVGLSARRGAEILTGRQINALSAMIRNGGNALARPGITPGQIGSLNALAGTTAAR